MGSSAGMLHGGDPECCPEGVQRPGCPLAPSPCWQGSLGGQLRVFYPFYCINMLYMTLPIINISYSRICVEGAKSLPLSKVAGSSAEVRAPVCGPKCPRYCSPSFSQINPCLELPRAVTRGKGRWCGGESCGMENQDLSPAGQRR